MYKAAKYYKGLNEKGFTNYPQFEYSGKNAVLPMLAIDMELQLFEDPGINRKCTRLVNIDTVTIIFENLFMKTVYTLPIAYKR